MPAYNEEGAMEGAVRDVFESVLDHVLGSEMVVVNDGSKDSTGEILDRLAEEDSRLRVIHQKNAGHGPAVLNGISQGKGQWFLLLDADREISLEAFPKAWDLAEQGNSVLGVRVNRKGPYLRRFITSGLSALLTALFWVRLSDANAPFKLFPRQAWESMKQHIPPSTLIPSPQIAICLRVQNVPLEEIPVEYSERETGVSVLVPWRLLKFCVKGVAEMLSLRIKLL
jgi:glycosyltransferase involved in cell wall biosynthesis